MIGQRRQNDVGQHAPLLRAIAAGAIELLHRELQRAEILRVLNAEQQRTQVQHRLHGAFAVRRRITDDNPAMIILNRAGQNLAGAGAELADHHHQRPAPRHAPIRVVILLNAAVRVFHLHDRSLLDE